MNIHIAYDDGYEQVTFADFPVIFKLMTDYLKGKNKLTSKLKAQNIVKTGVKKKGAKGDVKLGELFVPMNLYFNLYKEAKVPTDDDLILWIHEDSLFLRIELEVTDTLELKS